MSFLQSRYRRDEERHRSVDKAEKVFEKILPSDSRCSSRSSLASKEDISAKRLLTGLHSSKVTVSFFRSSETSRWKYPKLELSFNEKGKTQPNFRVRSVFLSNRNNVLPTRKDSSRIRRLPPPNFMKVSRNVKKRLFDPRVATTSKHMRHVSCV